MKLLDRYVGKQVLGTALLAIAVLSVVLVLGTVFKRLLDLLVNHDVPLEYILGFIGYILPFSLTYTIPWGFLTAVLLVFGRLSAENELIALRSSGVSVPRVAAPVFLIALVCTGVCLWINVEVAPRAQEKMKNALFQIVTSNPIAMFGSDRVIDEFPGKKIYVAEKKGAALEDILMYDLNEHGEPVSVVHARRGELQADLTETRQIMLHLSDARYEQRDGREPQNLMKIRQGITMEKIDLPISLEELFQKNKKRRGLNQMTLGELWKEPGSGRATAARTEISKRFSSALASFAFALIAVPLAITAHRRETSIGFLFSLIIAFVYFMFLQAAEWLKDNPAARPDLLIWAPNVLFLALGAFLFYRLSRR